MCPVSYSYLVAKNINEIGQYLTELHSSIYCVFKKFPPLNSL